MSLSFPASPLQIIPQHPGLDQGITLYIKRDDLLHPEIEGSKGRKLAAIIPEILEAYPGGLLTFGGAFSNHLHAVAVAGKQFGFRTTGILRGEYPDMQNPTLQFCQQLGMRLIPMPKVQFDLIKSGEDSDLKNSFPDCYILPEGGNTPQAVTQCAAISTEILAQLPPESAQQPLQICVPAGTGCTAAGVVLGLDRPNSSVLIFPVSNHDFDRATILRLLPAQAEMGERFELVQDYTFGGFAKLNPAVMNFARQFFHETNILLDPIYTAKMLFGVYEMLASRQFQKESSVVVLHTGGMQGWAGFKSRYGEAGELLQ